MTSHAPHPRWFFAADTFPREWVALDEGDSDIIELTYKDHGQFAEIRDGSWQVDIPARIMIHDGSSYNILRGTWFWQDVNGRYRPYPESLSELLESAFQDAKYGTKIPLNIEEFYVVLAANGTGKQWKSKSALPKSVLRGYDGRLLAIEGQTVAGGSEPATPTPTGNLIDFADPSQAPNGSNGSLQQRMDELALDENQALYESEADFINSDDYFYKPPQPASQTPTGHDERAKPSSRQQQDTSEHVSGSTLDKPAHQHRPATHHASSSTKPPPRPAENSDGILRETLISKKCRGASWKTRRLMLTKQFISVYSGRTEKKHLPFNKVTKAELGGSSAEMSYFNVHTYNKSYYFRAASPKDAVEWVNSIMKVKYGDSYKELPPPEPKSHRAVRQSTSDRASSKSAQEPVGSRPHSGTATPLTTATQPRPQQFQYSQPSHQQQYQQYQPQQQHQYIPPLTHSHTPPLQGSYIPQQQIPQQTVPPAVYNSPYVQPTYQPGPVVTPANIQTSGFSPAMIPQPQPFATNMYGAPIQATTTYQQQYYQVQPGYYPPPFG